MKRWFIGHAGLVWEFDEDSGKASWRNETDGSLNSESGFPVSQMIRYCREIPLPPWNDKPYLQLQEGL